VNVGMNAPVVSVNPVTVPEMPSWTNFAGSFNPRKIDGEVDSADGVALIVAAMYPSCDARSESLR